MRKPPDDLAEKLLEASDLFEGTGLDISVDECARLAGVPRATLYYYFGGKDDLVAFYLNDKLTRVGDAISKAAASEGAVCDRLEITLTAVLRALAEHPVLCVELPAAIKQSGEYQEVMAGMDRVVMAPLRELLIEGQATGELDIVDPAIAAVALMGALSMTGMTQAVATGEIDAEGIAAAIVPMLIRGLATR